MKKMVTKIAMLVMALCLAMSFASIALADEFDDLSEAEKLSLWLAEQAQKSGNTVNDYFTTAGRNKPGTVLDSTGVNFGQKIVETMKTSAGVTNPGTWKMTKTDSGFEVVYTNKAVDTITGSTVLVAKVNVSSGAQTEFGQVGIKTKTMKGTDGKEYTITIMDEANYTSVQRPAPVEPQPIPAPVVEEEPEILTASDLEAMGYTFRPEETVEAAEIPLGEVAMEEIALEAPQTGDSAALTIGIAGLLVAAAAAIALAKRTAK